MFTESCILMIQQNQGALVFSLGTLTIVGPQEIQVLEPNAEVFLESVAAELALVHLLGHRN